MIHWRHCFFNLPDRNVSVTIRVHVRFAQVRELKTMCSFFSSFPVETGGTSWCDLSNLSSSVRFSIFLLYSVCCVSNCVCSDVRRVRKRNNSFDDCSLGLKKIVFKKSWAVTVSCSFLYKHNVIQMFGWQEAKHSLHPNMINQLFFAPEIRCIFPIMWCRFWENYTVFSM